MFARRSMAEEYCNWIVQVPINALTERALRLAFTYPVNLIEIHGRIIVRLRKDL